MHHLSMTQALSIWGDLMDAYSNKNGFGSDTAEIYMHRLMPHSPALTMSQHEGSTRSDADLEVIDRACASLHSILTHFAGERRCQIHVDGIALGSWVRTMRQEHRVHVQIKRSAP